MISIGTAWFKISPGFRGGPIRWLVFGGALLIAAAAALLVALPGTRAVRQTRSLVLH